ncbi:MAG: hypothetical protein GYA62_09305 [Bacteroidales bacterium]|nr:hypothetical protein [Bacteroidales bacterium]
MNSPKHLSHKPIISVNDYDKIDALYADKTDVKALSIGRAQYDYDQISLKVWRHTDEKWSRQSEELPIHRNLDLSILFLAALSTDITAHYPQSNLREVIDNESEVQIIKEYYEENRKFIEPRLKELKRLLNETF